MSTIPKAHVPSQAEHDPNDPEEHFAWALKDMPVVAGSGMVTHPALLRGWSKHLWACGFAHRDHLASLADEDGNIHVSKLPDQAIRHQPPFRGPHHPYNNAARWVSPDEAEPQPVVIPDIAKLTNQERQALLYQFHALGMIPTLQSVGAPLAQETT
jgi:hypothetical protein